MNKYNKFFKLGLITLLAASPLIAAASSADQDDRAVSGTIACGGNHFERVGGTEGQSTAYVLRNYDASLPISINRLAIYDASGTVIADFNGASLPVSFNRIFGGGDNSLEPFQTALYLSADLIGAPLSRNRRPITVQIDWSADSRALIPEISSVRRARRQEVSFDQFGNQIVRTREERSRATSSCRSIVINKGKKKDDDDDDDHD